MSYPYGGGYPSQGYQAGPGYPQPGYGGAPQIGMPTPESASASAFIPQTGLPYGAMPPGGVPGSIGFGMGEQSGYPPAGQMPYPQNMGYGSSPAYHTPVPPAYSQPGGYPALSAPGFPGGGSPCYLQAGGYSQGGTIPGYGAPSMADVGYGTTGYAQPVGPGYQQSLGYPGQALASGSYGQGDPVAGSYTPYGTPSCYGGTNMGYRPREDGTLRPAPNFNAENDAKILRKAMKGFGTDEKAIIDVLAHRSNDQRQHIKTLFKTMYGKDLIQELKSELGGRFEDLIGALMFKPCEYDAYELKRAMRGIGTDEDAMVEILCSRNNSQMREINELYKAMYRTRLEQDIISDTSGHFKRLMVSMANGARQENQPVDINKANADAQALYQAGEKRWGTDESQFNAIIASQSYEQLRAVFDAYSRISGKDIEQVIKSEMSWNLQTGMLAIIKCVRNKPAYFAEKLYRSMKGLGTDDKTLIRVIVTRAEVDMVQIKAEFQRIYATPLEQFIRDDTSGDYRKCLLALVTGSYNH